MKSWRKWSALDSTGVMAVPKDAKGVYVIRRTLGITDQDPSDLIYIGSSGKGAQGLGKRLRRLLNGKHSAAKRIKRFIRDGLQFSWFECQTPDGVEKALLLAFKVSTGKLPACNKQF